MKKFSLFVLCVMLGLGLFGKAMAQNQNPIDAWEQRCIDRHSSTAGMANCTEEATKMWDNRMNIVYNKLLSLLPNAQRRELIQSQEDWLRFRNAEFKFIDDKLGLLRGDMYIGASASEKEQIVKDRVRQLESYLDDLNGD